MTEWNDVLVSAIIITYKRPLDILERAIKSVMEQTHRKVEIIVVNDYPEDKESVEKIRKMITGLQDDRIQYIVHERNGGACKARNTGIEASTGEFIALLDDDDEWLPKKLELQLQGFTSDEVGMVYSPFYNKTDDSDGVITIRQTKSGDLLEELLLDNCIGGSSMTTMRREVFDRCGMFDENLQSSQDYDMWVRIAEKYKVNYVGEPLTRRFLMEDSITKSYEKKKQGFLAFYEKHKHLYDKYPAAFNYLGNRTANKWIEMGHLKDGWKLHRLAVKAKPFSKYNLTEPVKGFIKHVFKIRKY